jgi:hypothetical protein
VYYQLRADRPEPGSCAETLVLIAVKEALNDKNWTVQSAAMLDLTADYADMVALLEHKRDEVRYAAAGQ